MVRAGEPASKIAGLIRSKGEYTDIKPESLRSIVGAYRESIPPIELAGTKIPWPLRNAIGDIKDELKVIEELKFLYQVQKERIEIDLVLERKIRKIFHNATEVLVAMNILNSIFEIEYKLGMYNKYLGHNDFYKCMEQARVEVGEHISHTEALKKLLTPEKRIQLVGVLKKLRNLGPEDIEKLIRQRPISN